MKKNPNELTIENSALVLIDHQPAILLLTPSIDQALLINNVAGLARTAKVLGVPVVLTTVGAKGSVLADPYSKRSARCSQRSRRSTERRRMPGRTRRFARLSKLQVARS